MQFQKNPNFFFKGKKELKQKDNYKAHKKVYLDRFR